MNTKAREPSIDLDEAFERDGEAARMPCPHGVLSTYDRGPSDAINVCVRCDEDDADRRRDEMDMYYARLERVGSWL